MKNWRSASGLVLRHRCQIIIIVCNSMYKGFICRFPFFSWYVNCKLLVKVLLSANLAAYDHIHNFSMFPLSEKRYIVPPSTSLHNISRSMQKN